MDQESLRTQLLVLTQQYDNGLDYIRNNPNDITKEEVQEHYKVVKDLAFVRTELEKLH